MRAFIAAALLGVFSFSVSAADIPAPVPYRAPAVVETAAPWTGFYGGLSGGYGWCGNCVVDIKGGFVGGQLGYNWQVNYFVFGIEGDGHASWIGRSETVGLLTVNLDNNALATARVRAGFAAGPALIYVTGGGAWARNEVSVTTLGVTLSAQNTQSGYAAGGGIEYMWAPNWTTKVEYMFHSFGSKTFFGLPSGDLDLHTVKVGVNYLFR